MPRGLVDLSRLPRSGVVSRGVRGLRASGLSRRCTRMLVVEDQPRQLLTLGAGQNSGRQAIRITDLAENEAAVAKGNSSGDDDL